MREERREFLKQTARLIAISLVMPIINAIAMSSTKRVALSKEVLVDPLPPEIKKIRSNSLYL